MVFNSRSFTALVRGDGLRQAFITPHCLAQKGRVSEVMHTLKSRNARHPYLRVLERVLLWNGWQWRAVGCAGRFVDRKRFRINRL